MSKKQKNIISRVLRDANQTKQFVGLTVRLKSNGQFRRINGQVHSIKINQDGQGYIVMENLFLPETRKDGRKWQSVSLDRVLSVRANGMRYKKEQ